MALMRVGWGEDNPAFRQVFTAFFMPEATKQQADAFNELQRKSASAECAVRYLDAAINFDVRDQLARVQVPTLVLHARGDLVAPVQFGRDMAAGISGARFVALEGKNHLFLENEPSAKRFFEEVRRFLAE